MATPLNHRHSVAIEVPADCFVPGRTYGVGRAELRIRVPDEMTPDRFREIVKEKGGKMGVACWQLGPQYGPVLMGEWVESGVKVELTGTVDVAEGKRLWEKGHRVA